MYTLKALNSFKHDMKKCQKRGYDMALLENVVSKLQVSGTLPEKYKAHKLTGNYVHHWEAHIKPDWLVIWWLGDSFDQHSA